MMAKGLPYCFSKSLGAESHRGVHRRAKQMPINGFQRSGMASG